MKKLFICLLAVVLFFNVNGQNMLYGPTTTNIQMVRGISPDGRYVVGQTSGGLREAFFWDITAGNVINPLGGSTSTALSEAFAVSNTGRAVGDFADPSLIAEGEAIRSAGYFDNGEWTSLGLGIAAGEPPAALSAGSHATSVSADGNKIGGFCITYPNGNMQVHPYTWTYNENTSSWEGDVWADPEYTHQGSSIVTLSADGTIAAGWTNNGFSNRHAILWTSKDDYRLLDVDPDELSEFLCVSRNGKYAGFRFGEVAGFYDVEEDEYFLIPEGFIVNGISDEGLAVGAYRNAFNTYKGFVWSRDLGFMDFNEFRLLYASDVVFPPSLANALDPNGFPQYILNAISPDGQSFTILSGRAVVLRLETPIITVPYPKNLVAKVNRATRNIVELTWTKPEAWDQELLGYELYRDEEKIETLSATLTNYTDINVDPGYRKYSVKAVYANNTSRGSNIATGIVVDSYNVPFVEDFNSMSFKTNFWTNTVEKYIGYWGFLEQFGMEGLSNAAILDMIYGLDVPYSAQLTSKPFDCYEAENVYLSYSIYNYYYDAPDLTQDMIYVDITTDGIHWENVSKYQFPRQKVWTVETVDLSDFATGELINVRLRIEGINSASSGKVYFFDNIRIDSKSPEGEEVPLNLIGREEEPELELAWQNPEGLYGLSYQQTHYRYAFGNEGKPVIAVHSFDAEELAIYEGLSLVSISSYINQESNSPAVATTLRLAVFVDGERVVSQDVTEFTPKAWNTFQLNTPILLSTVQNNLKLGIEVVTHATKELPLGADDQGDAIAGKGDLYSDDDGATWTLLSNESNEEYRRNWCIVGNVALEASDVARKANLMGYNVYLDGEKINEGLIFGQTYTTDHKPGCYTVRSCAISGDISAPSNPYCIVPVIDNYTITFDITDTAGPVLGATIEFDGEILGDYSVVVPAGKYDYTVSKEGYAPKSGTVTVTDADVTEHVTLTPLSSVQENSLSNIMLYPNPFNNAIYVSNPAMVQSIQIKNLTGQTVKDIMYDGKTISTDDLVSGIYFITIVGKTGDKIVHKLVKK